MKTVLKTLPFIFCALSVLALATQADASTLYGATSSGHGELYILNPATGSPLQDIGALNDVTGLNYSVTGLAFDPGTGVLYGSTGGASGTKLLTINPATASVSVVGSFSAGSATMTDLSFDQSGNLWGITSSGGAKLASINKVTGAATVMAASGVSFTEGGGLAISSGGVFYGAPIPGEYGTYDSTTGAYTHIAVPATPVSSGSSYGALAFDGSTLYGDNLAPGSGGGLTHLVKIDPTTGNVTDIGASVTHLDAIAFRVPEPGTIALLLCTGLISLFTIRIKR